MEQGELAAALARHDERISRIDGVVGTGVGVEADHPEAACIQVFVQPGSDAHAVREQIAQVLGDVPVEILTMGTPEAYGS
jgi:hypothetical protein